MCLLDPNTRIELLDKDNHVIGTGTTGANGHVIITPTQPIPEGNNIAKAYDNAEHPNSTSQPKSDRYYTSYGTSCDK